MSKDSKAILMRILLAVLVLAWVATSRPLTTNMYALDRPLVQERSQINNQTNIEQRRESEIAFEVVDLMFWHPICECPEYVVDRSLPIYRVYKNGWFVDVTPDLQWFIRDLADEHGFCERIMIGTILAESTFRPYAIGDRGRSFGLAQIQRFWITTADIERLTDDWRTRDLLCPYDNLITMMELWNHARQRYSLDMSNDQHVKGLLFWHNTGRSPHSMTTWAYSNRIFGFAAELVELDYTLRQKNFCDILFI